MSQNTESAILKAQSLLEANEDIIGGIIENMQLVRLDDCLKLYSLLHNNLVSLGNELDNYPYGDCDPYKNINNFPDEIMRRRVVDTLRPPKPNSISNDPMPKAPLPPPCNKCALQNISSAKCRVELGHVEPSYKFSITDREEYVRATQLLEVRFKEHQQELHKAKLHELEVMKKQLRQGESNHSNAHPMLTDFGDANAQLSCQDHDSLNDNGAIIDNMKALKGKRVYRRWTNEERHIVCLGVFIYGARNTGKIAAMLYDRSKNQVKSYIAKSMTPKLLIELGKGNLPMAPTEFNSNAHLTQLFSRKYPEVTHNKASDKLLYDVLNVAPSTKPIQTPRNPVMNLNMAGGAVQPNCLNIPQVINGNTRVFVPPLPPNNVHISREIGPNVGNTCSRRIGNQDWDMLMRIAARTSSAKSATFYEHPQDAVSQFHTPPQSFIPEGCDQNDDFPSNSSSIYLSQQSKLGTLSQYQLPATNISESIANLNYCESNRNVGVPLSSTSNVVGRGKGMDAPSGHGGTGSDAGYKHSPPYRLTQQEIELARKIGQRASRKIGVAGRDPAAVNSIVGVIGPPIKRPNVADSKALNASVVHESTEMEAVPLSESLPYHQNDDADYSNYGFGGHDENTLVGMSGSGYGHLSAALTCENSMSINQSSLGIEEEMLQTTATPVSSPITEVTQPKPKRKYKPRCSKSKKNTKGRTVADKKEEHAASIDTTSIEHHAVHVGSGQYKDTDQFYSHLIGNDSSNCFFLEGFKCSESLHAQHSMMCPGFDVSMMHLTSAHVDSQIPTKSAAVSGLPSSNATNGIDGSGGVRSSFRGISKQANVRKSKNKANTVLDKEQWKKGSKKNNKKGGLEGMASPMVYGINEFSNYSMLLPDQSSNYIPVDDVDNQESQLLGLKDVQEESWDAHH